MQITAYISGFSSGREAEDAAFAVSLRCDKETHNNLIQIKGATLNEAELYALNYAIAAILPEHKDVSITIHTANPYVYGTLQKTNGKWNTTPKRNIKIIKRLREEVELFKDFQLKLDRKSNAIKKAIELSKSFVKPKETEIAD